MRQRGYRRDSNELATNAGFFSLLPNPFKLPKWLIRHGEACGMPHNRLKSPDFPESERVFVDPYFLVASLRIAQAMRFAQNFGAAK